jgi:hypothetical protein
VQLSRCLYFERLSQEHSRFCRSVAFAERNPATLFTDWLEGCEVPAKEFQEFINVHLERVFNMSNAWPWFLNRSASHHPSAAATYGRPMQSNESSVTYPLSK